MLRLTALGHACKMLYAYTDLCRFMQLFTSDVSCEDRHSIMHIVGLWMATATFLGIWWGHVGVRWIEARSPDVRLPALVLVIIGLGLNLYSLLSFSLTTSGMCSIFGTTMLWDAFELYRQQKRVIKGHAPAHPSNPRHAAYLAAPNSRATTAELLKREPSDPTVGSVPSSGTMGRIAGSD